MTPNCNCHGSGGALSQTAAARLERPRYSPGLILRDSDLTAAVDYTRELNRLLFRNLFGCGVICGLTVEVHERCGLTVTVGAGLALDGCGDPVEVARPVTITVDERTVENWKEKWEAAGDRRDPDNAKFWIVLCGKEKFCEPRPLVCDQDEFDGASQTTRIRSHAEVTITATKPECVCGCLPNRDATRPISEAEARRLRAGSAPADGDPCQSEHVARDDCAPDCGCGTACACGCCVLLAEVGYAAKVDAVTGETRYVWRTRHGGVRRLVRPMMVPDHEPQPRQRAARTADATETAYAISDAREDMIVAADAVSQEPLTLRQLVDRFVGYVEQDRPRTAKLSTLKVVLPARTGGTTPTPGTSAPIAPGGGT